MTLNDVGYNAIIEKIAAEKNTEGFQIGRVISEQKERYFVITNNGEYEAEITGNMRFSAKGREDFPAVGDWVLLSLFDNNFGIITAILPRYSIIERRAAGKSDEIQIIGTNIDYAIIVQAADNDFNLNRIDRYLTICKDSKIQPIIVITKIDLFSEFKIADITKNLQSRVQDIPVISLSNETLTGIDLFKNRILKGKTYCFLGPSGVGKSSLINNLLEKKIMRTGEISSSTNKGKHTTSYRELIVLDTGGILIDNPGMREVGISGNTSELGASFDKITAISEYCKFTDCTHIYEAGCAVLKAVENGEIDRDVYDNYIKLKKERDFFALTKAEHRKKDKDFGKIVKNYKKDKKLNKF